MTEGYTRQILDVDLSRGTICALDLEPELLRSFVGGSGLAAKMLWDRTGATTEPFSDENLLLFMLGPFTGTCIPSNSRYAVAAISPLTGIWGEAYGGGGLPHALGRTPYLGVAVSGRAEKPMALVIEGTEASLVDARHLWGKDTYEVDRLVKERMGQKASVATIGPAGEKLVKFASVIGDGSDGRAAARCGLGAVMGWKKLKAVVVKGGRLKPPVLNETRLQALVKEYYPAVAFSKERWVQREKGLGQDANRRGGIKNFTMSRMDGFGEKLSGLALEMSPLYCPGCRNGCALSLLVDEKRHPPGQHLHNFGANCLIEDVEALQQAFELCSRLGLDSISTGQTIAFTMELYEKGLLTKTDCDGLELTWGNAGAMLELVRRIGNREGIGALLGEGVRAVARKIGGMAVEYAMEVKGLEFPRYDPRGDNAIALQYATSSRGAHHMEGYMGILLQGFNYSPLYDTPPYALPYLADDDARQAACDPVAVKGKAKLVAWSQDFCSVVDSLGICKFMANARTWVRAPARPFLGFMPEHFLEWLNCVTGWDMDLKTLMKTGERIFNLKRMFNVRRGMSRKDDCLPLRMLTQKRGGEGPASENLPHLGAMLNEYYACRGWNDEGIPERHKLKELGLNDLIM